ncbi:uL30 family ribosomal protein [Candidatus Woesearchaeota archaeon]|nr:uL30 family ribosomal protein [Candidatus Woesearchaeota archaeon]
MSSQIAAIRIRGLHDTDYNSKRTFESLRLLRKNACVLLEDTPSIRGQLMKVKDFITWGMIDEGTKKILVEKRGKEYLGRISDRKEIVRYPHLKIGGKNYNAYFNLNPPKGGFERKGVKVSFNAGGALGDRKDKINELIRKMV